MWYTVNVKRICQGWRLLLLEEVMTEMVTYECLFQIMSIIVDVVTLFVIVGNNRKK